MRELTGKELDAVCGGQFQLGFLSKQFQNSTLNLGNVTQSNAAAVSTGWGLGNTATVVQMNIAAPVITL
jgi:hypothetical protein